MESLPTTESSLWRETYTPSFFKVLEGDINVDVAIVGAGISGLTTAYLLKQSGKTVAVIDKDTVGGGTTGRTTGKVTSQHNLFYEDLAHRLGIKTAQVYAEANQAAIEQVRRIVQTEKIECSWQDDDNYVYTAKPESVEAFKREAAMAQKLGLPASFETTSPLPFAITGAVKFSGQGKLNAQEYVLGLARAVNGDGSYVLEHTAADRMIDGKTPRVITPRGVIQAKDIIVATSVPTFPLLARGGYCIYEYPTESYIVAGRLKEPFKGMYISPDKNHHSILPFRDGHREMLLVGGGGNLSGFRLNKRKKYHRLADYAGEYFNITSITHIWSDRDYMGYDGLPLIGKLYPWSKHMYVATAYGKWGLSNSGVAAMILRDTINGVNNPWADTFHPHRLRAVLSAPRAAIKLIKS